MLDKTEIAKTIAYTPQQRTALYQRLCFDAGDHTDRSIEAPLWAIAAELARLQIPEDQ
jgi:hypothetical protein